MKLIDLTHTLFDKMPVFPGDESPELLQVSFESVDGFNAFHLNSSLHAGTHMDAPLHIQPAGKFMAEFPVELFTSKAVVIDVSDNELVEFEGNWIEFITETEAVLFRTLHSEKWNTPEYYGNYPLFSEKIAEKLKDYKIRIVGFDSPSPDKEPFLFHKTFLKGNSFMIENLTNLHLIPEKTIFTLFSFPLKINAEASLIRAVAGI